MHSLATKLLYIIFIIRKDNRQWLWTFEKYTLIEQQEMKSKENMYYTGEEVKHPPSPEEAGNHYVHHGGAKNFATRYVEPHAYWRQIKQELRGLPKLLLVFFKTKKSILH